MARPKRLFLPELIEPVAGAWSLEKVELSEAGVDTEHRRGRIPEPHTPAQRLARFHEGEHVKSSPSPYQPNGSWMESIGRVMSVVEAAGVPPDFTAVERLSKMVEENRIDWILWSKRRFLGQPIDTRPAREVLKWAAMPACGTLLDAAGMVLQLAWTVWGSLGTIRSVPGFPPPRASDPDTRAYFEREWERVCDENRELGGALVNACVAIYNEPTDQRREQIVAELARYFPAVVEPERTPEVKPEEKEAREEAERADRAEEAREEEAKTGGTDPDKNVERRGHYEIHDHTARIRRPSLRIAKRHSPVALGIDARFAHRYLMDGAIFSQRLLNEAGFMIDASSSMKFSDDDLKLLTERLPAVRVGFYSGWDAKDLGILGRICIIAKNGRFAEYTGKDPGMGGGNAVDYEALQLLSTWPGRKFWLSDGLVCGGKYGGKPSVRHEAVGNYRSWGLIHEMCNALMKRHEILRVPDLETMHKLLKRQRVTLYRTTRDTSPENRWPVDVRPEPVSVQL